MAREMIDDVNVEKVIGGSIIFNTAHTMCGYNRNDQYKVKNFDAAIKYLMDNYGKMSERSLLDNLLAQGLISEG